MTAPTDRDVSLAWASLCEDLAAPTSAQRCQAQLAAASKRSQAALRMRQPFYLTFNDFRAGKEAPMDGLLTDNVAAPAVAGAIGLESLAQDSMRTRADAGASSFRRQANLQEHRSEAGERVPPSQRQAQADPDRAQRKALAAKVCAAQEGEQSIRAALNQVPEAAASRKRNGGEAEEARASITDADGRVRSAVALRSLCGRSALGLFALARKPMRIARLAPQPIGWEIGANSIHVQVA